jgi:peroxiredoxin
LDAQVLGVSCDSVPSHKAFAKECGGLDFPVLSDFWPHGEVAKKFGVFMDDAGHPRRSVFVLDREGVVRWAYHAELDEQRDINDILAALEDIRKQAER